MNNCLGPRGTLGISGFHRAVQGWLELVRAPSATFNYNFGGNKFGIKAVEGLQYNSLKD